MPMYLRCSCGSKSRVRKERANRRGRCPSCGSKFRMPSAEFISSHDGQTIDVAQLRPSEVGSERKRERRPAPPPQPRPKINKAEMQIRCRCGLTWPFVFPADRPKVLLPCSTDGCSGFVIRPPDSVIVENAGRELDLEEYHQATGYWYAGLVVEGQFEIQSAAAGGMGVVYFADHRGWGVPVAIKSAQRQIVDDERRLQRFLREIDAWSSLGSHPNIVQAFYAKTIDDAPRVVVEYAGGGSLHDLLDGPLALEPLFRWGAQICDGMSHAHQQNLVHRDLKPQNVLLADDRTARVTDFGLARLMEGASDDTDEDEESGRSTIAPGLTRAGKFMGTAPYAAPEQWEDTHAVGPAADIYAFGVMLFQMASGILPFWPTSEGETFRDLHLAAEPPNVLAMRPDLPEAVGKLIHQCLAKRVEDRPASFAKIALILDGEYHKVTGRQIEASIPDDHRRKRDLNNRAVTLVDLGRPTDALAALNEAVELDPLFVRARYNRALLRLREEGWTSKRAVAEYDEGPDKLSRDWQFHFHRGLLYLSATDFGAAERDLAGVIRRRPNDVDALNARGLSLLLGGEAGPAGECFHRAARLAPGRLDVQQNLAVALHEMGRNDAALAIYERVAEEALFRAEDRARYAALLASDNRLDEAQTQMERALEQDPESELVQRLAAEMSLGIRDFVPFPEPRPLPSIRAEDVVRTQAEQQPKNLRLRVCTQLLTDPSLMPAARQARVREFGRGLCPRHLAQDPVAVWDCMRSSLNSLQTGRALGRAPVWLDVLWVLLLSVAFAGYGAVALSKGQAGAGEGAMYALIVAAPAGVAAFMLRMGAAWWLAWLPFALTGVAAAAVDIRLYGDGVTAGRVGFVLGLAGLGGAGAWVFQSFGRWHRGLRHRRLRTRVSHSRWRWLYGQPSQEQTIVRSIPAIVVPALFVLLCPAIDMVGERASYGELRMLGGLLLLTSIAGLWQLLHVPTGFFGVGALVTMTGLMSAALAAAGVESGWALVCFATMLLLIVAQWSVYRVTPRLWPLCRECELTLGRWGTADTLDPLGLARDPVSLLAMPPEGVAPPYAHLGPIDWLRERAPALRAIGLLGLTAVLAFGVIPRVGMPVRLFQAAATSEPVTVDEDAWRRAVRDAAETDELGAKLAVYSNYSDRFRDGVHAEDVAGAVWSVLQEAVASAATLRNRLLAYQTYLSVFPKGRDAARAQAEAWRVTKDWFDAAPDLGAQLAACAAYIDMLPNGNHAADAEDAAWRIVKQVADSSSTLGMRLRAIEEYLRILPNGSRTEQAKAAALQAALVVFREAPDDAAKSAVCRAYDSTIRGVGRRAGLRDEMAWLDCEVAARASTSMAGELSAYRAYLATSPQGYYADQARSRAWQVALAALRSAASEPDRLCARHTCPECQKATGVGTFGMRWHGSELRESSRAKRLRAPGCALVMPTSQHSPMADTYRKQWPWLRPGGGALSRNSLPLAHSCCRTHPSTSMATLSPGPRTPIYSRCCDQATAARHVASRGTPRLERAMT